MKISRLTFSSRHCSSLCQQQHAAAASRTMSSRSSRMLARSCSARQKHHMQANCAYTSEQIAPCSKEPSSRAKERRVDPRTTLSRAACRHLPLFSACPPQAKKIFTATQTMLQNDVLENGLFKLRPKLAESSSKHARLAPSQLVGDGGAVDGWRSGRLQLASKV